jgi:beta-glucosidase
MMRIIFSCLLLMGTHGAAMAQATLVDRRVDSLLALMTTEEKIGQLTQYTAEWSNPQSRGSLSVEQHALIGKGLVGSFLNVTGADAVKAIQRIALSESRLGIPLLFGLDVIHGYRTVFPIPLGEAATWDPPLITQTARCAASEASAAGIQWTFAPMVDIARDPRWGRIAEGSGEDPYLGSLMAAARVRGFQGEKLSSDSTTILACAKHFVAYGAAEGGRDYNTADISDRSLRTVYLPPFQAAVRAGAGTLMSAFNDIGGVPCSGNRQLLTTILRGEWGFTGFVVSDWGSVAEMIVHGTAADSGEAAQQGIEAGVDMDMVSGVYRNGLPKVLKKGLLATRTLDEAVRRVLRVKFAMGLFEHPFRGADAVREKELLLAPEHRTLARDVAAKSIVLLKNDGALLPLSPQQTIAVIGLLAGSGIDQIGCWNAQGRPEEAVTLLAALQERLPQAKKLLRATGCPIDSGSTAGFAEALAVAKKSDVVVAVLGESSAMSGEASCRASLALPGHQEELLEALHATGKPVVLIVLSGRPLAITWAAEHVPAILQAWHPGTEGGHAIADVLFGDVNPSGRLPVSMLRATGQIPLYYAHKNTGRPADHAEHYTSKYLDMPVTPLFPFGFGLSYTSFRYSDLVLNAQAIRPMDTLRMTVRVTNTGKREGTEVVQLYLRDDVASVARPVKELRRFQRITIPPGELREVMFELVAEDLAFYNQEMRRVIEPGTFTVTVGPNAAEGLTAKFRVN